MRALYWVRNDLRFDDNATLNSFTEQVTEGLFFWSPTPSFLRAGRFRKNFIQQSVIEFKSKVEARGGTFLIFDQAASKVLPDLVKACQISAIFFSSEPSHEEKKEETLIESLGLQIHRHPTGSLIPPERLPFAIKETPESFTKFRNWVEKNLQVPAPLEPPQKIPHFEITNSKLECFDFGDLDKKAEHTRIQAGETAGLERVQSYIWKLDRIKTYKQTRNGMIEWDDSSKFSPWLSVGALSARRIYDEILKYQNQRTKNESTYWLIFELLWREYFRLIAEKWGAKLFTGMTETTKAEEHSSDADSNFRAWCAGATADDFVNANMRELNQTGWMSNRGRQNVASYLCNTLGVDWRKGAAYFEAQLIDYDCSSNWGNWAYIAGVGQSTQDRSFDTRKQASIYDPLSEYRKRWLKNDFY